MPLLVATLQEQLALFLDKTATGYAPPDDAAHAAFLWGEAVDAYVATIAPPSLTMALAKPLLVAGLSGMRTAGPAALEAGFSAYAAQLALGMLPAFAAATPPLPGTLITGVLPLAALGLAGASPSSQVAALASVIDLWFRTGTAVPIAGPPPIFWA